MPFTRIDTSEAVKEVIAKGGYVVRPSINNIRSNSSPDEFIYPVHLVETTDIKIGDYWCTSEDSTRLVRHRNEQHFVSQELSTISQETKAKTSSRKRKLVSISKENASNDQSEPPIKKNKIIRFIDLLPNALIPYITQFLSLKSIVNLSITAAKNMYLKNIPVKKLTIDSSNSISLVEINKLFLPEFSEQHQHYPNQRVETPKCQIVEINNAPNQDINAMLPIVCGPKVTEIIIKLDTAEHLAQKTKFFSSYLNQNLNITRLTLNIPTLTDQEFVPIAKALPNLSYLNLFGCEALTSKSIAALTEHCIHITALDLGSLKKMDITESSMNKLIEQLPNLTTLSLKSIPIQSSFLGFLTQKASNLQNLQLFGCQVLFNTFTKYFKDNGQDFNKDYPPLPYLKSIVLGDLTTDMNMVNCLLSLSPNLNEIIFSRAVRFRDATPDITVPNDIWSQQSNYSKVQILAIESYFPHPDKLIQKFPSLHTLILMNHDINTMRSTLREASTHCNIRYLELGHSQLNGNDVSLSAKYFGKTLQVLKLHYGTGIACTIPLLLNKFEKLSSVAFIHCGAMTNIDLFRISMATPMLSKLHIEIKNDDFNKSMDSLVTGFKNLDVDLIEQVIRSANRRSVDFLIAALYVVGVPQKELNLRKAQFTQNFEEKLPQLLSYIHSIIKRSPITDISTPKRTLNKEELSKFQYFLESSSPLLTSFTSLMLFLVNPYLNSFRTVGRNMMYMDQINYLVGHLKSEHVYLLRKHFRSYIYEPLEEPSPKEAISFSSKQSSPSILRISNLDENSPPCFSNSTTTSSQISSIVSNSSSSQLSQIHSSSSTSLTSSTLSSLTSSSSNSFFSSSSSSLTSSISISSNSSCSSLTSSISSSSSSSSSSSTSSISSSSSSSSSSSTSSSSSETFTDTLAPSFRMTLPSPKFFTVAELEVKRQQRWNQICDSRKVPRQVLPPLNKIPVKVAAPETPMLAISGYGGRLDK